MAISLKRYVHLMLAGFAALLVPILVLNLMLIDLSLHGRANTRLASQWQQETHGVVSAPSPMDNGYLKLLRLHDRLPQINTAVLGASTSFGITQEMFPPPMQIYNASQNGLDLAGMIGEAEYLLDHTDQVKWMVIPLDWSVGFIYQTDPPPAFDLDASLDALQHQQVQATWLQEIQDALSYPRIVGLFHALGSILSSDHKLATFRQIFLQAGSDEYRCTDGTLVKDYDKEHKGACRGFRSDGSWTYENMDRVSNPQQLILLAMTSDSKYLQNLSKTAGRPNPAYLERLAALAHRAKQRGGDVIFIEPPMLSGMEAEIMHHPQLSGYLSETRQVLSAWATRERLTLLDAGQSEKFGCTAAEFTDEHHATPACFRKIFTAFWRDYAMTAPQ